MQKKTAIINRLAEDRAEYVGFCRFLNNTSIRYEDLISEEIQHTRQRCKDKHVLVINDTTELNYQSHINFLHRNDKELGPTGNDKDIGFFLHPCLVIDVESGMGIGFSHIKIWNRQWNKKDKVSRNYKQQAIEEKESYRWIESGLESKKNLPNAKQITIIADRESDIYEEFVDVPDRRTHLIIRSRGNRSLKEGDTLYDQINQQSPCGRYPLKVRTTKNRTGRQTEIEVKYTRVTIRKPDNRKIRKNTPTYIEINAVEAREVTEYIPKGEKPIHWVLLTTHSVNNLQDVLQIIFWYGMRWQIELLFSTMKSSGLDIEDSELESGKALKVLCIMAMQVSLLINQLRQARNDQTGIPASIAFTANQIRVLTSLVKQYERKTDKQKNPYKKETLAWAAWTIARMGGWKGYTCECPPGNKTFKMGIDRFNATYEGFMLHEKLCA